MIGGYLPPSWRWREPATGHGAPFETFKLELRRGCLALAVLAELRTERYGYALRQALAKQGLGIEQGTLYPLLRRLETQGLLTSEWRNDGKRRKRFYRLTPNGRRMLDLLLEEWRRIDRSLGGIIERPQFQAA